MNGAPALATRIDESAPASSTIAAELFGDAVTSPTAYDTPPPRFYCEGSVMFIYTYSSWARLRGRSVLWTTRCSVLAAAIACGGGMAAPSPGDPPVSAATVAATPAISFMPGSVTLAVGGAITFAFGGVPHNVYFDNAPTGAPENITTPSSNQSVVRTFSTAGRFAFNCHIHPGMSGVIAVR
jgi:plastocyanin